MVATFTLRATIERIMPDFNEDKTSKKIADLHEVEEERLAQTLATQYGVKYVNLVGMPIDTDALKLVEEDISRQEEIALFEKVGNRLFMAVRSPGKESIQAIVSKLQQEGFEVTLYITSQKSLEKAWDRYADIRFATESKAGLLDISGDEIEAFLSQAQSKEHVATLIQQTLELKKSHRVTQIIEIIIAGALSLHASDIHIEPEEDSVGLRFRLDGILTPVLDFDRDSYGLLLSRIKLLSGTKLNVADVAQDGRFTIELSEKDVEVRTSVLPGAFGESIVLRILDPGSVGVEFEALGMRPEILEFVKKELSKPNGMILNTGPTGSGKTTTLYAFLRHVHHPGIKIVTIEDPIEYHLEDVTQTQVDRGEGYTFISGLTSALRQDPDVIMVGEIRDEETAKTAVHAALTGHLVFSTLHTNTAAGTFPRFLDLGANSDILGSAINFTMAQRLVRKLCDSSKIERSLTDEEKARITPILESITDKSLYEKYLPLERVWGPGEGEECPDGYKGRIGIFEVIEVTPEIEALVKQKAGEREIAEAAVAQGHLTMKQDGILKVLEGVTSLEELERVIEL